jgi:hypothetical protein
MASKEPDQVKKKSQRGKRVDYRQLHEFGADEQESFWTQEHIDDMQLLSEAAKEDSVQKEEEDEDYEDEENILQMKKELSLLQQEEKKLKGKSISAIITFYL